MFDRIINRILPTLVGHSNDGRLSPRQSVINAILEAIKREWFQKQFYYDTPKILIGCVRNL